jgi:hypothetical protein
MKIKLYLANIRLSHHEYPDNSYVEDVQRIVIGTDENDAKQRIIEHFTFNDDYGHGVKVFDYDIGLFEAIGGELNQ